MSDDGGDDFAGLLAQLQQLGRRPTVIPPTGEARPPPSGQTQNPRDWETAELVEADRIARAKREYYRQRRAPQVPIPPAMDQQQYADILAAAIRGGSTGRTDGEG
jgi:hypothetical protein